MITTTQLSIFCNNCTHTFSILKSERYTTCPSCGTHLMIEESDETITTVIIPKRDIILELPPVPVRTELGLTELKQELQILKAEWNVVEEKFKLFEDKNKIKKLPSKSKGLKKSLGGLLTMLIFFFSDFDIFFLTMMGLIWFAQGLRELYYWHKYNIKRAEYKDQLKTLEENIQYLS